MSPTTTDAAADSVSFAFSGDILIHSPIWKRAAANAGGEGYDFRPMFRRIAGLLESVDMAICHLEVPVAPDGEEPSTFPKYGAPAEIVEAVVAGGYDRCSTASNHSMDRGTRGIDATLAAFEANGIGQSGMARTADDARPVVFDLNGVAVAHLSYTWAANGIDLPADQPWRVGLLTAERVIADATAARSAGAEIVIASLHWGLESSVPPVRSQVVIGEQVTASGVVDLIVGHHAHVVQPISKVNDRWIVYGVGNSISNMPPDTGAYPPSSQDGIIVTVTFDRAPTGGFTARTPVAHPTWVDKRRGFVIRDVLSDLADPDLDAGIRRELQVSLRRTSRVVGEFVAK
jgi:poly-gamma-glutamate synthesis protein (capsule biosynthesis protein)